MNPHKNGLHPSPCLRKQREKEKETSQKRKSHVSFGTAAATKLGFGLFSLIALATNIVVSQHPTEKERHLYSMDAQILVDQGLL